MNNILVGIIVGALILGGIGFWVNNNGVTFSVLGQPGVVSEPEKLYAEEGVEESRVGNPVVLDGTRSTDDGAMTVVEDKPVAIAPGGFVWMFKDTGVQSTYGAPVTSVTLRYNGKTYDFSGYEGTCFDVAGQGSAWKLLEGELAGAICYWAGGGYEVGIFNEGGKLVAKKGVLSEGDAETPSFRGDFKQILVLE